MYKLLSEQKPKKKMERTEISCKRKQLQKIVQIIFRYRFIYNCEFSKQKGRRKYSEKY